MTENEEENEREAFRRRFRMFQNVLRESWVYQEIGQEFLEEGEIVGQRKALMRFLQLRFPEVMTLAAQQTKSINDPEIIQTLLDRMFTAQTTEEAKNSLVRSASFCRRRASSALHRRPLSGDDEL